jgi:methyltransferase-like protein/ubiquinone/menaquinone biosynthesis C-methylase UbiE
LIYDDFLYDDFPFRTTHVDILATLAGFFGLDPAPPERCRVLELGAGLGGNLLGMAVALPDSHFVGMDLSVRQVAHARAEVEAMGITNAEFFAGDILELGPSLGRFDYIICHGVWSWVPEAVRTAIFRLCRELLMPQGVAFISYNCMPGWSFRGVLRQLLLRNVPAEGPPEQRAAAARRYLEALYAHAPVNRSMAARVIRNEIELIRPLSDRYLFHEHLAEENHPVWFRDFLAQAAAHDLQYLGDAELHSMMPDRYGPEAESWLRRDQPDLLTLESRLDELGPRYFRRTLLCHAEATLDRRISTDRIAGHWVTAALDPHTEAVDLEAGVQAAFTAPDGFVISTTEPILKAALACLHDEQPRGLPLETLAAAACARLGKGMTNDDVLSLGSSLLELLAQGYVEISRAAPRFVLKAGRRPRTTLLARRQAQLGREGVINQRHISVAIDPLERALLRSMDGKHDRSELADRVAAAVEQGEFEVQFNNLPVTDKVVLGQVIEAKLERLGRMALLVA